MQADVQLVRPKLPSSIFAGLQAALCPTYTDLLDATSVVGDDSWWSRMHAGKQYRLYANGIYLASTMTLSCGPSSTVSLGESSSYSRKPAGMTSFLRPHTTKLTRCIWMGCKMLPCHSALGCVGQGGWNLLNQGMEGRGFEQAKVYTHWTINKTRRK